jgi:predicted RNA-binding Zn ribbon-like protein
MSEYESIPQQSQQTTLALPQKSTESAGAPPFRIMAVVALAASAGLLLTGKRKAGVAVAAIGTAFALLEDPDTVSRWWCDLPAFIGNTQQALDKAEQVVHDFADRGTQLRNLISKVTNR